MQALRRKWYSRLQESHCLFRDGKDDLFADYDDSLVLAKRYEARHRNRPPSLHTEFQFDVEFRGFRLIGAIDSIEPLVSPEGELLGLGIVDYKTAQEIGAAMKHYRQLVFYHIAVHDLAERGVLPPLDGMEVFPGIDYVRHQERKFIRVGPADYDRIERELKAYRNTVEKAAFLPASTLTNADRCDFPENCCLKTTCGGPGGEATPLEVVEFA
jgi:RecB family exonuclease